MKYLMILMLSLLVACGVTSNEPEIPHVEKPYCVVEESNTLVVSNDGLVNGYVFLNYEELLPANTPVSIIKNEACNNVLIKMIYNDPTNPGTFSSTCLVELTIQTINPNTVSLDIANSIRDTKYGANQSQVTDCSEIDGNYNLTRVSKGVFSF